MSKALPYSDFRPRLIDVADRVAAFELIWPIPLIVVGMWGLLEPIVVGIAVVLAVFPWLLRLIVWGRPTQPAYVTPSLFLFGLSGLVGMWAAYNPQMSWPMFLTLLGSICLFFAFVNTSIHPTRLAEAVVILAGLVALYFVGQYAHFDYQWETGRLASLGRITGAVLPNLAVFIPHPNAVAGFLEGTFLLTVVLFWRSRSSERFAWAGLAALIAYGLLITQSRGSWLGLGIAIGLGLILSIRNRRIRLITAGGLVAGLGGAIFTVASLVNSGRQVPVISSALNTADDRWLLYRNSFNLWGDYIFTGIGLGDVFAMIYSRYQLLIQVPYLTYSHNLYLTVGLGMGLLGLIALVWLLLSFYTFVVRVELSRSLSKRSLPLFRAAWLGVTVIFVHGLTDAPQFSAPGWSMPMLFALLGLSVTIGRRAMFQAQEGWSPSEPSPRIHLGWTLATIAAIGLIVIGVAFWRPIASLWYANLGAVYQTRADLSPHLNEYDREVASDKAIVYFANALDLNQSQVVANRRFGLMALDKQIFDVAVTYLERAYRQEPLNQATLKALGLAYLWTGQLDSANNLLSQLDDQNDIASELGVWHWWWGTQDRDDLSQNAAEMQRRLARED